MAREVPEVTDIGVIGSGPAGAAIARKLALLGHDVCLIEQASFPRSHVGESLPPSVLPILDSLGIRQRIEDSGFLRPQRAIVFWARATPWEKLQPGEPGFQVDRGRFDQVLLDAAAEAGVRIIQPARVRQPVHTGQHHWILPVVHSGKVNPLQAHFLVDASGRRSVLRGRKRRLSVPTIAIYAYWRHTGLRGPETRVEAKSNTWFWGAPLPDGRFNATVFVDPKRCAAHARSGIQYLYRSLLASSTLLRSCLAGQLVSEVRVCDASSYTVVNSVGADWIKVGEAAFAIDPLSSQGVQTAMKTGLQGAIVAHTMFRVPENTDAAIEFYQTQQAESVSRHHAFASQYYAEQNRFCADPFWEVRSSDETPPADNHPWPCQAPPPAIHETVMISEDAAWIQIPVMQKTYITRYPALTHPALHRPVAFLHGIALAPLLQPIGQGQVLRDLLASWSRKHSASLAGEILHWMWTRGILVRKV